LRESLLTKVTREPAATVNVFGETIPPAPMVMVVPPLGAGLGVGVGAGVGDGLGLGAGAGDGLGDGDVGLLPPPQAAIVSVAVIAAPASQIRYRLIGRISSKY
jgi:hypothetical protein